MVLDVGGADQREVALVGNREDDALVGVLEDVGVVVVEQPRHDDVAALDQAQRLRRAAGARARRRNCAAHGPAALTSARACSCAPPPSALSQRHLPARRRRAAASTQRRARAGPSRRARAASIAFSTTRRASSTQPSE